MNHFDVLKTAPADKELNARDLKVLMHILSRVPVETMQSFISRDQISEATNISKNHISATTAKLCRLGWLKKEGNGGRSSLCKYTVLIPEINAALRFDTDTLRPSYSVWNKLKKVIFERDGFKCVYCGDKHKQLECDHIVPLSKGGSNHIDNLNTSCHKCNSSKGSKLIGEWVF